jgi:hypothetical protein
VRTPEVDRWLWACRAVAKLGTPRLRESGYPDFEVKDRETGACVSLSLEDVGAFIYHAPEARAAALRGYLVAGDAEIPDCTFEVGVEGALPLKVGVRNGKPFQEGLYSQTFAGQSEYFTAHPNQYSAGGVINEYLRLDKAARPKDASAILDRAVDLELDQFQKMEASWLSPVGKQGYCLRTKELAKLPVSAPRSQRIAAERKRFCSR